MDLRISDVNLLLYGNPHLTPALHMPSPFLENSRHMASVPYPHAQKTPTQAQLEYVESAPHALLPERTPEDQNRYGGRSESQ